MKNLLTLLLLPLFSFMPGNKLNDSNGFRDYTFGTSPDTYKNLSLEIEEAGTKLYSLDPAMVQIDNVELEYFRLNFIKNKLSDISLQSKHNSGNKLLDYLKDLYGEPVHSNVAKHSYEWLGPKLQVLYEGNASGKDAVVTFSGRQLTKK